MYASISNQDEQSWKKERAVKIGALGLVLIGALVVMAVVLGQQSSNTKQLESMNKMVASSSVRADAAWVTLYNPQYQMVGSVEDGSVLDASRKLIGRYYTSSGKFYSAKNGALVGQSQMQNHYVVVTNAQGTVLGKIYQGGVVDDAQNNLAGYAYGADYMSGGGAGLVFGLFGSGGKKESNQPNQRNGNEQNQPDQTDQPNQPNQTDKPNQQDQRNGNEQDQPNQTDQPNQSVGDLAMQVAADNWISENSCRNYCYDTFYRKFYNYPNYLRCEQMCFSGKYALWTPHSSSCMTTCHSASGTGDCHAICYPPL